MDQTDKTTELLELNPQPAFCVKDGVITYVNESARQHLIEPGTRIAPMLLTGAREYGDFTEGCLYLCITAADTQYEAYVTVLNDCHLFRIEQPRSEERLQAMALAAQELRQPLSNMLTVADQLIPETARKDPAAKQNLSQLSRSIYQLLRIVTNMSDAYRYATQSKPQLETVNLSSLFDELLEKTASLLDGRQTLRYSGPGKDIYALAEPQMLSQAVYNLLSNAVKFSPAGSQIDAKLAQHHNMLYFSVVSSVRDLSLKGNVFTRYQRQPGIEDGRVGIGLGMALVRSAAAAHGGTVLMDQQEGNIRFTMTIDLKQRADSVLRSSMLKIDPLGGLDAGLIHLSDALSADCYEP